MNRRLGLVFAGLILGMGLLSVRLCRIQVIEGQTHRTARAEQSGAILAISTGRGAIRSAEGDLLVSNVDVSSIYADPGRIEDPDAAAAWITAAFGGDAWDWREKITRPRRRFVWIARHTTRSIEGAPAGIATITEARRVYPYGRAAAALLGFTNIDGVGREGVERANEETLKPRPRRVEAVVDSRRRAVSIDPGWYSSRDGYDIRLTINLNTQRALDASVQEAAARTTPLSISAVAIDPWSGAILALSTYPSFDPNRPGEAAAEARLNRVITNPIEPGSAIKPLIVARALERGVITPEQTFVCTGRARVGPRTIRCHKTHGVINVVDVVVKSCNIGAAEIGFAIGPAELQDLFAELGFGRPTGVDLPAESRGRVTPPERWNAYTTTSTAIGYEISVTPLQLAVAMGALASDGRRTAPRCLDAVLDRDGRPLRTRREPERVRVFAESTARQMRAIMRDVVERGTGRRARVDGLSVAGKTGTSQKLDPRLGRYTSDAHVGTFVAMVPGLVVVFVVDEPQGAFYGGEVAAPFVGKFLERIRDSIAPTVNELVGVWSSEPASDDR